MKSNVIILVSTGGFAITFGTYAAVRLIRKYFPSPVNTLVRPGGDIRMVDYIEPVRGQQTFNYTDLLAQPSPIHDRIPNYGRIPSYWSGNPPSYRTVDIINCPLEDYINSPLEDYINLDYILILILSCFLFLLIISILLRLNPYNKWLLIIFLLYYNSGDISTAFIAPLSISKISYIDDLDIPAFPDFELEKIKIFNKFTIEETNDFLRELEDNESYLVELGFIPNISFWDIDAPQMLLSKPILINKNSSSTTITKFILERLDDMVDTFYLDDAILQKEFDCGVSLTYCKLKSI
jgi:hypothetical protein